MTYHKANTAIMLTRAISSVKFTSTLQLLSIIIVFRCEHCRYYKAPLVHLQKQMAASANTKNAFIARIDVTEHNRMNPGMAYVTGVPAVLFAHNGEIIDLFMGADFEKLGMWIHSLVGLSAEQVKEKKEGLMSVVEERKEVMMREEQKQLVERRKKKEEELRRARLKKRRGG